MLQGSEPPETIKQLHVLIEHNRISFERIFGNGPDHEYRSNTRAQTERLCYTIDLPAGCSRAVSLRACLAYPLSVMDSFSIAAVKVIPSSNETTITARKAVSTGRLMQNLRVLLS